MPTPSVPGLLGFRACLARVLDVDPGELPAPAGPDPMPALRGWLAQRDLGLAPVADPGSFAWAGFWLGRVGEGRGGPARWVVLFGVPSGVVLDPAGDGGEPGGDAVEAGFVVAELDPSPARRAGRGPSLGLGLGETGVVEAIFVASAAGAPMRALPRVRADAGGLEGDRYAAGAGTFSNPSATGTALTLVEGEALEACVLPDRTRLPAPEARRNLVTRGVALDRLLGRRFLVGDVPCYGQRRCEPCAHLQRLTRPGVLRAFVHRGGLRADVLAPGTIELGAAIRPLD